MKPGIILLAVSSLFTWTGSIRADTISGNIQYQKRRIDANGFTGDLDATNLTFIDVEVRDHGIANTLLASGATDANGNFSITYNSAGITAVDMHVLAQGGNGGTVVNVRDFTDALHSVEFDNSGAGFAVGDLNTGTLLITFNATNGSDVSGAWNIAQVIVNAAQFVENSFGGSRPSNVKVIWEDGVSTGTFYDPDKDEITILGNGAAGDTDEFDDAVIIHEYGHAVSARFSKDDSPGGTHSPGDNLDLRLSWSEGWADFFSCAALATTEYRDTGNVGTGGGLALRIDFEEPRVFGQSGLSLSGSDDEIAVAATLLDIFDGANEPHDGTFSMSGGLTQAQAIFQVFDRDLPQAGKVSIEDFWDGWFGAHTTNDFQNRTTMDNIASNHGIEFFADAFENDGAADNAADPGNNGTSMHHTFYFDRDGDGDGNGDEDWAKFQVTTGGTFTIATHNLTNAADTILTLFDDNGEDIIDSNDDFNGGPRSQITFQGTTQRTLLVRVTRKTGQVAKYGSYNLTISGGDDPGGNGGGNSFDLCFIATAAYGSPLQGAVRTFRDFRDDSLLPRKPGKNLSDSYARIAPLLAHMLSGRETLRAMARHLLRPMAPP